MSHPPGTAVGRTVHYRPAGRPLHHPLAAIITQVCGLDAGGASESPITDTGAGGRVCLTVFPPLMVEEAAPYAVYARYSETPSEGTWMFPPRV